MIKVCIVENDEAYKDALLACLEKAGDISVTSVVSFIADLSAVKGVEPDVVVVDIEASHDYGAGEVRDIKKLFPGVRVVLLLSTEDNDAILRLLRTGAMGCLLKKHPPTNIVDAVQRVSRDEGAISGVIAGKMLKYFQDPVRAELNIDNSHLTSREREILALLMDGLSYKEIALKCYVSLDTINSHIRKIYMKLNVRSRAEISARFRK